MWVQSVLIWTSSFVLLDHIKYNLLYTTYSWISCILVSNIHYINPLVEIVINYQNGGDCKGTLPLCVVLVINDNPYGLMFSLSFYMKEYSIGNACSPYVGFKYGCHEDKDIPWVLASRSSIWRDEYDMIKKKKWRWSSCVELK